MAEPKRILLRKNARIRLSTAPDGTNAKEWTILGVGQAGDDGICVHYEARQGTANGSLREFYPSQTGEPGLECHMQRTPDGQLNPIGRELGQWFSDACEAFLMSYHNLRKNRELREYLPDYQILYGRSKFGGQSSVYIWTPEVGRKISYGQYLERLRREPEIQPEEKLKNILDTMIAITGRVGMFHDAGVMHLGLSPAAFLMTDPGVKGTPETNSLMFRDANGVYPVEGIRPGTVGDPDYRAREAAEGKGCPRSDLYALGAMLYHGIVVHKENPEQYGNDLYQDGWYEDIGRLLSESDLICASTDTGNAKLQGMLRAILQKTLASAVEERYENCAALSDALKQAARHLARLCSNMDLDEVEEAAEQGETLPQETTEKQSGKAADANPVAVMQELLFRHPLYERALPEMTHINVLVLGAGTYGQIFLDHALQAGQLLTHKLRVDVYSDGAMEDCEQYLQSRKALDQFVHVCSPKTPAGSMKNKKDRAMAEVYFYDIPGAGSFRRNNGERNREILAEMHDPGKYKFPHQYAFIALGSDALNREVAAQLAEWTGESCSVFYVCHEEETQPVNGAEPVQINRSLSVKAIDPMLERMGFYTHLCWEDSLNLDWKDAWNKFRDKYNYNSSLAYALSIPGKLESAGIHLHRDGPIAAAKAFRKQMENQELFDKLVALEHRRWVLEKVTTGWVPPVQVNNKTDYTFLTSRGMTKDPVKKIHPCLVQGKPELGLKNFTRAQWDTPGRHDVGLDHLDRMSVELHRSFQAQAQIIRETQDMRLVDLSDLRSKLVDVPGDILQDLDQYQLCLWNILEGSSTYSKRLRRYAGQLKKRASELDALLGQELKNRIDMIGRMMGPVAESNLRKDYKKLDDTLVKMIPFILTYQPQPHLAMVFDDGRRDSGRNSAVFANVASATVINPRRITYLYYFDRQSQVSVLTQKMQAVISYFENRKMECKLSFLIAFAPEGEDWVEQNQEELRQAMEPLKERSAFSSVTFFECQDSDDASEQIVRTLTRKNRHVELFDCSTQLFASPRDNLLFLRYITEEFPNFEFDWKRKKFSGTYRCEYLHFIEDHSYVSVHEMFSLMNAEAQTIQNPGLADVYEKVWDIYTGSDLTEADRAFSVSNWNALCESLSKIEEQRSSIIEFTYNPQEQLNKTQEFYLPSYMYPILRPVLRQMKHYGLVKRSSTLHITSADRCRLSIQSDHNIGPALGNLVAHLYLNVEPAPLVVEQYSSRAGSVTAKIRSTTLVVKEERLLSLYSVELLKKLKDLKLIHAFSFVETTPGTASNRDREYKVSFRYASPAIKNLLTCSGQILELYTYYAVKAEGYFDDVVTGYEFNWESGGVANELDCVLTKGFRSIIVECKATYKLEQDFYYKLNTVADRFGLGTIKVLVSNNAQSQPVSESTRQHVSRGEQLGIITITDLDEIKNIGATLRAIMEGTYGTGNP